jgi:hypothetical protein
VRETDTLKVVFEPTAYTVCDPQRLITLYASVDCYRDRFTFYTYTMFVPHRKHTYRFLTACYVDSFTFLYVNADHTSQETRL